MERTLVVLAHPHLAASRVNAALADGAREMDGILVHDLYAAYPDLQIDVAREQRLLRDHDHVVLQFPFYWYSAPALLKKWLDEVFEHGFAYGTGGDALRGKTLRVAASVGGGEELYRPGGLNRFPVVDLLRPFDATANLTGMPYLPPFLIHGSHAVDDDELAAYVRRYQAELVTRSGTAPGDQQPVSSAA
ncbi:NAD(P)H-dependent oxidoreductase [Actinomadura rudentiformis]|uniref:Oxidoreductase n=1 Tax=Actinomadura rudentiformis TaxID=359158 RepID=A0A6H9YTS0_9ACTN|nr:NAD(P)H-dependent oxidoreductase [Actinomadura rudentiformis]KAB2344708.1 oxidoreductase [Actinomadura rudentiformis]